MSSQESDFPKYIWYNGEIMGYHEPVMHPMSTAPRYGALVFEGLRGYWSDTEKQLYVFKLEEHCRRLVDSIKILRIKAPLEIAPYVAAIKEVLAANEFQEDVHIRIQVFVDRILGSLSSTEPIGICAAAQSMGKYYEGDGKHICVSSWTRISDNSMPPRIKSAANYQNSRLAALQAFEDGYDDVIMLTAQGKVAEGSGYNVFMMRGGRLVTPPITDGILEGITREVLMALAREQGLEVVERSIDRTELYVADEVFFSGTAAEVTPILSVDRFPVGQGTPGEITLGLRERYLNIARGEVGQYSHWLTPIS